MERKIGEIFEYNGEWYQCINTGNCSECAFTGKRCYDFSTKGVDIIGDCTGRTFKKLENIGEPYRRWLSPFNNIMVQRYRLYGRNVIMPDEPYMYFNAIDNTIEIEVKQNEEDMEEKKLNLKPFDIQKAREGKPVCTHDGRKARIICWNIKDKDNPIAAAVSVGECESVYLYTNKGEYNKGKEDKLDLMMLSEKKEGWVNVYYDNDASSHRGCRYIYDTKEQAIKEAGINYITTIKINWEE